MRLGSKVAFTSPLRRVAEPIPGSYSDRKVWKPIPNYSGATEGILIGIRTLTNGTREWSCGDEGCHYLVNSTLQAALVAIDLRRKPVLVTLDNIQEIEEFTPGPSL